MSSETSTEAPRAASEPLQPWHLFTLAGLLGATIVVFLSPRGVSLAVPILLSLLVFSAAAVGLAALRVFGSLTGIVRLDAVQVVGGRTRAALEREKALVLRSIKELEFDSAMGKVSEKDFAEMGGRLRLRAAGLLRQLDAGTSYREQIEREISRRVVSATAASRPQESEAAGAVMPEASPDQESAPVVCASCQTHNDPDARFCKECGSRVEQG